MGARGRKAAPVEERFMSFVQIRKNGCWVWKGGFGSNGVTPKFSINMTQATSARKFAFKLLKGYDPKTVITSRCPTKNCIHPDHTTLAISNTDKRTIRKRWQLHLKHSTTLERLGEEYNVTRQRIEQIVNDRDTHA